MIVIYENKEQNYEIHYPDENGYCLLRGRIGEIFIGEKYITLQEAFETINEEEINKTKQKEEI